MFAMINDKNSYESFIKSLEYSIVPVHEKKLVWQWIREGKRSFKDFDKYLRLLGEQS
jgi:hypothetical protein